MPFQPPINRPRPPMPIPQNRYMNTGWRDAYSSFSPDQPKQSLPGFYISSPQDILPRDVPMDGSISFFPANDLSYIIIKQWTGNGTIAEEKYVLDPQNHPQPAPAQQEPVPEEQTPQEEEKPRNDPEIVEVISAALNEQTQRLTAAFSQIGLAFNTLQQKLDSMAPIPRAPAPLVTETSADGMDFEVKTGKLQKTPKSKPSQKEKRDDEEV